MPSSRRVAILVYDEVEVLDVAGPYEVFSVASRLARRRSPEAPPPFVVSLISVDGRPVHARGGFVMTPHNALADAPAPHILIVPGGVADAVERNPTVTSWLRRRAETTEVVASVCTGAFVLAAAGLLDGFEATTHWEDASGLGERYPSLTVNAERRWIDHGRVATSAGISAGIDLALHLVARFASPELAAATARQMDHRTADSD